MPTKSSSEKAPKSGSMYIVTEGLLGAYAGGKQIGIAGPGTVVGEMSFVDQDPTRHPWWR